MSNKDLRKAMVSVIVITVLLAVGIASIAGLIRYQEKKELEEYQEGYSYIQKYLDTIPSWSLEERLIKKGDSLTSISEDVAKSFNADSEKMFGYLVILNKISYPDNLKSGTYILVPVKK